VVKRKTWKSKLTKAERKHLTESGIRTKAHLASQAEFQKDKPENCWDCHFIAKKVEENDRIAAFLRLAKSEKKKLKAATKKMAAALKGDK
jgi:hypothetical protein